MIFIMDFLPVPDCFRRGRPYQTRLLWSNSGTPSLGRTTQACPKKCTKPEDRDVDSHGLAAEPKYYDEITEQEIDHRDRASGVTIPMSPCGSQLTTLWFQGAIGGRHIDRPGRAMSQARRTAPSQPLLAKVSRSNATDCDADPNRDAHSDGGSRSSSPSSARENRSSVWPPARAAVKSEQRTTLPECLLPAPLLPQVLRINLRIGPVSSLSAGTITRWTGDNIGVRKGEKWAHCWLFCAEKDITPL